MLTGGGNQSVQVRIDADKSSTGEGGRTARPSAPSLAGFVSSWAAGGGATAGAHARGSGGRPVSSARRRTTASRRATAAVGEEVAGWDGGGGGGGGGGAGRASVGIRENDGAPFNRRLSLIPPLPSAHLGHKKEIPEQIGLFPQIASRALRMGLVGPHSPSYDPTFLLLGLELMALENLRHFRAAGRAGLSRKKKRKLLRL